MIFEDFEKDYPPRENCVVPAPEAIQKYERLLPADLIGKWREAGWCSYGKGLLWMVDPEQLNDVLDEFVNLKGDKPVVFLRTAFAHLYFWHDGFVYSLDVHGGSVSQVTEVVAEMFTLLCHPRMKEKILRVSLFKHARQKLGDLGRDECYAFEPALALGGAGTPDTIRRVPMREHLAILAQLNH